MTTKRIDPILLTAVILAIGLHLALLYAFEWPSSQSVKKDASADVVNIRINLTNPVTVGKQAVNKSVVKASQIPGSRLQETEPEQHPLIAAPKPILTKPLPAKTPQIQARQTKQLAKKTKAEFVTTRQSEPPKKLESIPAEQTTTSPNSTTNSPTNKSASKLVQAHDVDHHLRHEHYIKQVLSQLEKNKFYPRKARRRQIEGAVVVTMAIKPSGEIHSLEISEGHGLLRKATAAAIERSLPLIKPPLTLAAPETIQFSVDYRFQ